MEVTTVAPIIELEQLESIDGLTARTFKADGLDDELAAMFAEFENEEENEFLFDFVPSDAQFELMNEEEDESGYCKPNCPRNRDGKNGCAINSGSIYAFSA